MNKAFLISIFAALFISCSSTKLAPTNDQHSSRLALDWNGIYNGFVSINNETYNVQLALFSDLSYKLRLGLKNTGTTDSIIKGSFEWDKTGSIITLQGSVTGISKFKVIENRLAVLPTNKKNESSLSTETNYFTKDVAISRILANKWTLTQLRGENIQPSENTAYIQFNSKEEKVSGNLGCNGFFGSYELGPMNRLRFKGIAATMKMCPDMKTEDSLNEVLNIADSYILNGNQLQLIKGRMAPLATFELK